MAKNSLNMEEIKPDFNNVFFQQASILAKIGSWEIDVVNDKLYWSTMVHELHGTNPKTFILNLETALGFYRNEYQSMVNEVIVKSNIKLVIMHRVFHENLISWNIIS